MIITVQITLGGGLSPWSLQGSEGSEDETITSKMKYLNVIDVDVYIVFKMILYVTYDYWSVRSVHMNFFVIAYVKVTILISRTAGMTEVTNLKLIRSLEWLRSTLTPLHSRHLLRNPFPLPVNKISLNDARIWRSSAECYNFRSTKMLYGFQFVLAHK
jgi:hypothetical protein